MAVAANIVAFLLLLIGLILRVVVLRYRTEWGRTVKWYEVKYWFMPWKAVDYLTPTGMKMFTTSTACIFIGIALALLAGGIS
jgi:hypothetical protein